MNNPNHISESLKTIFWVKLVKILKFFYADPGSGLEKIRIRDGKCRIRDPQHCFLSRRLQCVQTYMNILLQVSGSGIPDSAGEVCEAEPGAEQAAGRLQGRNGR